MLMFGLHLIFVFFAFFPAAESSKVSIADFVRGSARPGKQGGCSRAGQPGSDEEDDQ